LGDIVWNGRRFLEKQQHIKSAGPARLGGWRMRPILARGDLASFSAPRDASSRRLLCSHRPRPCSRAPKLMNAFRPAIRPPTAAGPRGKRSIVSFTGRNTVAGGKLTISATPRFTGIRKCRRLVAGPKVTGLDIGIAPRLARGIDDLAGLNVAGLTRSPKLGPPAHSRTRRLGPPAPTRSAGCAALLPRNVFFRTRNH